MAMAGAGTEPTVEQPFDAADPRSPVPWAEVRRRLAEPGAYWLATTRPDGRPHVVPVLPIWVDGALYFVANAMSRKARNLAHDPRCVVTVERAPHQVVIEGIAVKVGDAATLGRVADAYGAIGWPVEVRDGALHGEGAPTAGPSPYAVFELTPTKAFGFGTDDTVVATRWRFSPAPAGGPDDGV
jgi:hypothetical protein